MEAVVISSEDEDDEDDAFFATFDLESVVQGQATRAGKEGQPSQAFSQKSVGIPATKRSGTSSGDAHAAVSNTVRPPSAAELKTLRDVFGQVHGLPLLPCPPSPNEQYLQ